ncbi:hypothetical protein [Cerasicoccus frondis]|uniref:hypothetical protein n=1 Tax=Cerasicoccus frondis TaxID=490090 RepID=UPI0028526C67|nr:hypothetical protein [Cerasicoccus frondis]
MRTYLAPFLLSLLGLGCSLQAKSNQHIEAYIFEYNSNLYMTMYGSHQTEHGSSNDSYNFKRSSETVDYATLETSITPNKGYISFLDSSYTSDEYTVDDWYSSTSDALTDDNDSGSGYYFGSADTITFDSGTTYSASSGGSYLFRYAPFHENHEGWMVNVYTEEDYSQEDTMAFFAMASGKTLDDIGLSDYSDNYDSVSFTNTNDEEYTFDAYIFEWKTKLDEYSGVQYYKLTVAQTDVPELIADVIAYSGGFTVSELEEMYELIYDGNTSSGGDEFLVDPTVPEPSTYALGLGLLTLGTVIYCRNQRN